MKPTGKIFLWGLVAYVVIMGCIVLTISVIGV